MKGHMVKTRTYLLKFRNMLIQLACNNVHGLNCKKKLCIENKLRLKRQNFTVDCMTFPLNGNSRCKITGNIVLQSRFMMTIIIMKYKNTTVRTV